MSIQRYVCHSEERSDEESLEPSVKKRVTEDSSLPSVVQNDITTELGFQRITLCHAEAGPITEGLLLGLILLLPFHLVIKRVLPEPLGTAWKEIVVGLLVVAMLVRWARIGRATDLGGLRKRLSRQGGVGSDRVSQEQDNLETSEVLTGVSAWPAGLLDKAVLAMLAVLGLRFLLQALPALRDLGSDDVRLATWGLYTLARYVPIYFVVIGLARDGRGLRPYLMAMLVAGALSGFAAALEFGLDRHWIVSQDIYRTYGQYDLFIYGTRVRRAYATFDFSPALGGYLASLLPLTVALIPIARPGWRRAGLVVTLGLLATGLAFTFSRGPWLAGLAGLGVLGILWVGLDRDRRRAIYLAGVLIALAALFWLIGAVAAARAPADMGNVVLAQLRSAALVCLVCTHQPGDAALLETGRLVLRAWLELQPLVKEVRSRRAQRNRFVLNGIAWDPETKRLFVTGKCWPTLFVLRLPALDG